MATSKTLSFYDTIVEPFASTGLVNVLNSSGHLSNVIDNTVVRAPMAMVFLKATAATSAAPTANTPLKCYLIRRSNSTSQDISDAMLSTADAAMGSEPVDGELLGSVVMAATAGTVYGHTFIAYDLPPKYSIAVWNATGQPLGSASSSQHVCQVLPIYPESQ